MKKEALIALALSFVCGTAFAATGTATLKGTTKDAEKVSGEAVLTDTPEGLQISLQVRGVSPGKHGFHIHEGDSCADEGKAAGGHFNPDKAPHGLVSKDGFTHAHAGDFGNVEAGADGTGVVEIVVDGLTLTEGSRQVANRTLILHEKEDDFGQPTGNAGGRIACGQIRLTEPVAAAPAEATAALPAPPKRSAELEAIKALEGRWQGTSSEKGQEGKAVVVEYRVTSGGTAVQETIDPGGPHEMVSMYHDRNGRLSMTHYCMLGNQPELELKSAKGGKFVFRQSETSTEALQGQMAMRDLTLVREKDTLTQSWTAYGADGKAMPSTVFTLKKFDPRAALIERRKKAAEAAAAAQKAAEKEAVTDKKKDDKKEDKKKGSWL